MVTVDVYREFRALSDDLALPIAAIKALAISLKGTEASTMMGLERELRSAADVLKAQVKADFRMNKTLSVEGGCDLFIRYILRTYTELAQKEDFEVVKNLLIERGEKYAELSVRSREQLAVYGYKFIADGATVLLHGCSRAAMEIIRIATQKGRNFDVIVPEGRPSCDGYTTAKKCSEMGIPVTIIMDSAVAAVMERVHVVLVGAEGIMVNGGVLNSVGTFQLALIAKAFQKPFYVAAESFKFTHLFPLNQQEIADTDLSFMGDSKVLVREQIDRLSVENIARIDDKADRTVDVETTLSDYTAPEYITLMLTDLGVLTPAGISDACFSL